jgi:hypothetical protein
MNKTLAGIHSSAIDKVDLNNKLHQFAHQLLETNQVEDAWKVLLS